MRRNRDFIGPAGMGGMVGLWGASSLIESVQTGTIAVGVTSPTTATVTAVDVSRSILISGSWYSEYNTGNGIWSTQPKITLTNSTTITASTNTTGTGVNSTTHWTLIQFRPGVLRSVQYGTVATLGSTTATITTVDTSKSLIFHLGFSAANSNNYGIVDPRFYYVAVYISSATTVTGYFSAGGTTNTTSFCVAEFF